MTQAQNKSAEARKAFPDFKIPSYNFNALFSIGQRNIEALTAANQAFVEGAQAIAKRQAEIFKKSAEEAVTFFRAAYSSKSPEANVANQSKFIRNACDEGLANAQELCEMATKSNVEAAGVITNRLTKVIGEVGNVAKKANKSSNG